MTGKYKVGKTSRRWKDQTGKKKIITLQKVSSAKAR
jgi:hypothetical protein